MATSAATAVELEQEAPLRHTLFHIPPAVPFKNASCAYLKHDSQTVWSRNSERLSTEARPPITLNETVIIHPGSRWLRVGRASDPFPVSIPHVIARKMKTKVPDTLPLTRVHKLPPTDGMDQGKLSAQEVTEYIGTIRSALMSRMDFYKIPYDETASREAAAFNEASEAEKVQETDDVYKVDWVTGIPEPELAKDPQTVEENVKQDNGPSEPQIAKADEVFIGHKVFRLTDPLAAGYHVRWPIYGNHFNTRYYESMQEVLGDIEEMWRVIIEQELQIRPQDGHAAILVIPDYFDKNCITALVDILLNKMGFRLVSIQQEGFAACLGSGLTTACIVDIGSVKTSVSCIEDGLLLSDSRMLLDYGGDDITEFLHDILQSIKFPYWDIDLTRLYDLHVMDDLKARLCTLSEADVGSRTYDFFVRAPYKPTEKYHLKAYDETIVAPMCIFEPKIIDFEGKAKVNPKRWDSVGVDSTDLGSDNPTLAMVISTQHLLVAGVDEKGNPLPAPNIDVKFEAAKLPLDVAIFNSVRAAGNDKIRKFLQTVVVVGGTALIPGAIHALESRLQAIAFPLVPNIERLNVVAPAELDPRVIAWKGAAVIAKLDLMQDLWIGRNEWNILGMRCLRERSLIDRPSS